MAGYEYEAQEVVANVIVNCGFEIRHRHLLLGLDLAAEFFVLALEPLVSAQEIDCAMLRGGHQPGARVVRNSRFRPLLEGGDESVLRQLLGMADVTHDPRETRDDPGGLNPPDRVDRAMCIGSRHGYRSHHLYSASASRGTAGPQFRGRPNAPALAYFGAGGLRHGKLVRAERSSIVEGLLANLGYALP